MVHAFYELRMRADNKSMKLMRAPKAQAKKKSRFNIFFEGPTRKTREFRALYIYKYISEMKVGSIMT